MKRNLQIVAAGLAIFFAAAGPLAAAHLTGLALFGVSLARNELVSINPETGAGTLVGSLGDTVFATGLGVRDGRLYLFDQVNDRIREVNKISGKLVSSIDIGVGNLTGDGALAFRADGVGFLASPLNGNSEPVNDFYMFTIAANGTSGTSVRLGSTGVAIDAMAFNSQGTLYAIGQTDGTLYTISTTTGAATAIGPIGPLLDAEGMPVFKNSPIAGMTVAPPNPAGVEEIYAAIDDRLYVINPASGAATAVSADVINFGPYISSVSGLAFSEGAGTLGNMSGRLFVGTDERVAISGFIIRGTPDKKVVVRGLGPSMTNVPGVLADPVIELFNIQEQSIARNEDFGSSGDKAEIEALGLAPGNPKESAILRTLPAGNYTAVLSGANEGTGIGLVEVYDVEVGSGSRLANLSTRGFVRAGDGALIAGTIVSGSAPQRVVLRAIGPDLANRRVGDVLEDPNLEVFDANGTSIKSNDNFATDPDAAEIASQGLAPANNLEAATIVTLAPGGYTTIVRGAGNSEGVALAETYNITPVDPTPATAE